MRDVAVKILRDSDLGRERTPAFWHFDIFLLKNRFTAVIGDFSSPFFPFYFVKWRDAFSAENAFYSQALALAGGRIDFHTAGANAGF